MDETDKFKQAVRDLVKLKEVIEKTPTLQKEMNGKEDILAQNIQDRVIFYKRSVNAWNPYFKIVPMSVDDVVEWVSFPRYLNGVAEYIAHFKREAERDIINQIAFMACAFANKNNDKNYLNTEKLD